MNEEDRAMCALVRWLARKAIKAEWKAMGRNPQCADAEATNVYFMEHREELIREARNHPVAKHYRHQERMKVARKAVIAEIRDRGGRVNSIAPEELKRLIETYLRDHPEESVIREFVCY